MTRQTGFLGMGISAQPSWRSHTEGQNRWQSWAASSPHTMWVTHGDLEDTDEDKGHLGFQSSLLIVVFFKNTKAVGVYNYQKDLVITLREHGELFIFETLKNIN